jgi:phosphonate transport system permease protein
MEHARQADMSAKPLSTRRDWSRFKYPQSLIRYGLLLGVLMFLAYSVYYLNIPLERFMGMFGRIGDLLADRYYPPDLEYIADRDYLSSVIETIQMAYLGALFRTRRMFAAAMRR